MKKKVAILSGGYSQEAIVSQKSVQTILDHIDQTIFEPYHICIDEDNWFLADDKSVLIDRSDFSISLRDEVIHFEYVYIMVHGTPGEDGLLQGYFLSLIHI